MANNRSYIACTICGEPHYFMKYYPEDGWFIPAPAEKFVESIEAFFKKHADCMEYNRMWGPTHFAFLTEDDLSDIGSIKGKRDVANAMANSIYKKEPE